MSWVVCDFASLVSKEIAWYYRGIANTMGDFQIVGGIKKLNNNNYNTWATCMMSYLQGHDLWEIVGGCKNTPQRRNLTAPCTNGESK